MFRKIDLKDNFETVINGLTFVAPISYAYDGQYKTYRVVKNRHRKYSN